MVDFGDKIDKALNYDVLQLFNQLKALRLPFITDIVPAYCSLAVYFDVLQLSAHGEDATAFDVVAEIIEKAVVTLDMQDPPAARLVRIPVCYEASCAPDLPLVAHERGLSAEEVVSLHTAVTYRVYMIGFLPGFPYMGEVDERIAMSRKAQPRTTVSKGSVGIAGRQTGIYPLDSPGGWQIIGRTPVSLFERSRKGAVLLQPGDEVQFYSISEDEFTHYKAGRS